MKTFLKSYFKIDLEKYKKKIFYCFLWFLFFFSINVNPEELYKLSLTKILKLTIPSLLFIFFLIFNLKKKKNFFKGNLIIYFSFITYIFLGVFFIFLNPDINSYLNMCWGVLMLFPFLYIYSFKDNSEQLKLFLILSLFMLFFAFTFYFAKIVIIMILSGKFIFLYGISSPDLSYFNNVDSINPRSSGLARMSIIIYISLVIYLINSQKVFYSTKLICTLAIFFGSTGLTFQSRTVNFIFIVFFIILILIYFKKKKLANKNYILLVTIIPVIFASTYLHYSYPIDSQNTNQNFEYYKEDQFSEKKNDLNIIDKNIKRIFIRKNYNENFSSHRFEIWSEIIKISKKNNFMGYGFQADRKIVNESAHNVYIYALICGGIISVLLIFLISLRSALISFLLLFNYIFFNEKYSTTNVISLFLIIFFLQRGLLESSYGIYSIDYLLFIICFFINEINYKKIIYMK
jgi:hypothetical protein